MSSHRFTAQISRDGDFWLIHVPAVDRSTQARNLGEVQEMATDLVATMLDIDPQAIEVDIERPERTITVITAVHAPHIRFLPETYASLQDQELPDDWRWQWAIQVDGDGDVPTRIADDPRVRIGRNRPSGPAATRTMALASSAGVFVRTLDADDKLLPGALARDVRVMTDNPDVGWTVAPALDLRDGDLSRWDKEDPEPGLLPRGFVIDSWRSTGWDHLTVLPSTMCIRRSLLLALGGWMALPTSEDTGLLAAASELTSGWFHREPGNIYRKHADQLTASGEHQDSGAATGRRTLILARAQALRHSGFGTP